VDSGFQMRKKLGNIGRHPILEKHDSESNETKSVRLQIRETIEGIPFLSIDILCVEYSESDWENPVVVLLKVKNATVTISDAMDTVQRMKRVLNR
jgi:hypothetical protein